MGSLLRAFADKGLADERLAECECLVECECLAEEALVDLVGLEVLAGSAESIIMTSESAIGVEGRTLRGVLVGEDEHEEDELEEDVLEDIFLGYDEELIIYIFTGKISSYFCTFFILFACVLSGRCEKNSRYKHGGCEVASASKTYSNSVCAMLLGSTPATRRYKVRPYTINT